MKIIDRYVFSSFLRNYLISFMVLIGMYVVLDMVFHFDELSDVDSAAEAAGAVNTTLSMLWNIVDYYFFQSFMIFVHLSGIIPVVAAAFTLLRLSRFNELTALLAAGVPLLRISMPIIIAGVVLNGLMIADQEVLIPAMLPKLSRAHDDVHRENAKSFPIQAMQDNNRGLLYAGRYTPGTDKDPPTIETFDLIERGQAGAAAGAGDDLVAVASADGAGPAAAAVAAAAPPQPGAP